MTAADCAAEPPPAKANFHDTAAIDRLRSELRIDPRALRRLRIDFFKKGRPAAEALQSLPPLEAERLAERILFHPLKLAERRDSQRDGASKLLLRTAAGYLVESVILRPTTGRTALCVSSQVGCAAACDFCATGRMGMAHNLSAAEVLDQVVQANILLRDEGRRVRNIVFMGMGEPLHNEAALHQVLASLTAGEAFNHPAGRILVSTVGIPEAMLRLANRFPTVHQALSLHSPSQEVRESIVPLARKYSVDQLRDTVAELNRRQACPVMLEHLMLGGVNDDPQGAERLLAWTCGLRVHVNLIPYNTVADAPHLLGSSRDRIEAFGAVLKRGGVPTTIRYSLGADIEAACGQLVRQENREIARTAAEARR